MPLYHSSHLAVFNDKNQILLVKRKDVPVWVIPGGRGEEGETPLQTALREFSEETGSRIRSHRVQLVAKYISRNNIRQTKYLFTASRKKLSRLSLTTESSDFGFFDVDNLPQVTPLYEQRKIHEAFVKTSNSTLVRKDDIFYISEITALLRQPVRLTYILLSYIKAKRNK